MSDTVRVRKYARLTGDAADGFHAYIAREYRSGRSIRALVTLTGASYGRVHQSLVMNGVPRRPRGPLVRVGGGRG